MDRSGEWRWYGVWLYTVVEKMVETKCSIQLTTVHQEKEYNTLNWHTSILSDKIHFNYCQFPHNMVLFPASELSGRRGSRKEERDSITECGGYSFQSLEEEPSTWSLHIAKELQPTVIRIEPKEELRLVVPVFNVIGMKDRVQRTAPHDDISTQEP